MRIVVLDGYAINPGDLSWEALRALGQVEVHPRTLPHQLMERIAGAQAVLTNKVPFDASTLRLASPTLRYVGVTATGFNIVDTQAAAQLGICVTNVPAYSTHSVAQMVMAHLLAITNSVEHYSHAIRHLGRWSACPDYCFFDTPLTELAHHTMGIVGLGRIGQAVAGMALAFGMRVVASTSKAQSDMPAGVEKVTMDQCFAQSDVLSLHCPLTPHTHHLVNAQRLSLMKPTAILVNTSRGGLIDEAAVAQALSANRLGYFAADVLADEPPLASCPLLTAPRVQLTPHIAWATRQARERLMQATVQNLQAWQSGAPQNVVSL